MYKIALVCRYGASTGIMVEKIKESAKCKGVDLIVEAYPEDDIATVVDDNDIVVLGPQLGYKKEYFEEHYPSLVGKCMVISPVDFGRMNGEKVLLEALAIIGK